MKVARIVKYPLKSVAGTDLEAAYVHGLGVEDDRRWCVVRPTGDAGTRREMPELSKLRAKTDENGLTIWNGRDKLVVPVPSNAPVSVKVWGHEVQNAQDAGEVAAQFLSAAIGTDLRLAYFPPEAQRPVDARYGAGHFTGFSDGFPVLLTTTASLEALNAELRHPVGMERFRANIVIEGDFPAWAEDEWRLIRIGSLVLRQSKPCERCIMVTQDVESGEKRHGNEPLVTLRTLHRSVIGRIIFGQNMVVEVAGDILVGDTVEVLERGPSNLLEPKRED